MQKEYNYLLHLLRAFINGTVPEKREDIDWNNLITLAGIHQVQGMVGYLSMQYKLCSEPQMAMALKQECLRCFSLQTIRASQMERLIKLMNEEQINHLLFKGYLVKEYYPVPELRTYGDIDFVIQQKDREKSHQLMLKHGYTLKTDWEPVFSYYKDSEFYEIHTNVMEIDVSNKADYKGYFSRIWEHVVKQDEYTWHFTPEFHFIYLLTHIAKHIHGAGAGIRMYMDIACFVKHFEDSIDWQYVKNELQNICLYDFACTVFTAVEEWFAVKAPMEFEPVPEEVVEEFTKFTLEAGIFGHVNRDVAVNKLKHEEDASQMTRVKSIVNRLFPDAQSISTRYTYLQKRPWLLPVAWVHRLFKTSGEWKHHAYEAQNIMSTDSGEVNRLRKLQKDIGL